MISDHPQIGRERAELMPGIRSFAVLSWVIFYRIEGDAVEIARVVHGARDLDDLDY
jgi:toxin ParE1/3/4